MVCWQDGGGNVVWVGGCGVAARCRGRMLGKIMIAGWCEEWVWRVRCEKLGSKVEGANTWT